MIVLKMKLELILLNILRIIYRATRGYTLELAKKNFIGASLDVPRPDLEIMKLL